MKVFYNPDKFKGYSSYFQYFLDKTPVLNIMKKDQIIFVRILKITNKLVIVDGNLKQEAYIKLNEFKDKKGYIEIKVGDFVKVIIKSLENRNGQIILSRLKCKKSNVWSFFKNSFLNKVNVKGYIYEKIKGGFNVMVNDKKCFLPFSTVDKRVLCNLAYFSRRDLMFKIIKVSFKKENVILSRKVILENILNKDREIFLKKIKVGCILKGIVKNMTNKGVFISTGFMNGLVLYKNVSWGPYKYPNEILSINQAVKTRVLMVNKKKNLYLLGIKQMEDNPWLNVKQKYKVGYIKYVKVYRLTRNFIHVILEKNLFATIKKSFTVKKLKNILILKKLKVNSYVKTIINKINFDKKKIIIDLY